MRYLALIVLSLTLFGCGEDTPKPPSQTQDMDLPDTPGDLDQENDMPTQICEDDVASTPGTDNWDDSTGRATVGIARHESCLRTYTISTTAPRRDDLPANPRVISELEGAPRLRTGNDLFDALYALALEEVRELSVENIRDGAFNNGDPVSCGGCFETGRKWNYVWTRDTAYAVHLGLAALDPARTQASLEFKLSERRAGGDLQIVQDTGTGGSYPVSTDRVSWALGAEELLANLSETDRSDFAARALEAISNTLEHDREVVFDAQDGLYRGETSFLDWREQTYAEWTAQDTVHIGMSKALSTNVLHMRAMKLAAEMAQAASDPVRANRYSGWASELKDAIQESFWIEEEGLFASFTNTHLDGSPARVFDLLGSALAVISDVATEEQSRSILARYPHYGHGAPVIFPQQQFTPIYHNRGEWPFVSAYWMLAAKKADNHVVFDRMFHTLIRGAALNLSNMENLDAETGLPFREDGEYSGPVVNSQRQLWSVAGYISMVHQTIFGIHPKLDGLHLDPFLTPRMARVLFGGVGKLELRNYPWLDHKIDITIHFPDGDFSGYEVERVSVNGTDFPARIVPPSALTDANRIDISLRGTTTTIEHNIDVRDASNWRQIFKPRTPEIATIRPTNGKLSLDLASTEDLDHATWTIWKNGAIVATNIPGSQTQWEDPSSDSTSDTTPCYAAQLTFTESGNHSQHSRPLCWWGENSERLMSIQAAQFTVTGGTAITNHGRFHYEAWGDEGHSIVVEGIVPTRTGEHLFQVVYGNGAGGVTTGITAAVKRMQLEDVMSGSIVGSGYLFMPHLGAWDIWADSNLVRVVLEQGRTYRLTIDGGERAINMSSFAHFDTYTGGLGGQEGAFNRVNIAELKVLAR